MSIKIIIADDHQLFREGLVNLLSEAKEIEILAQVENGKDAVSKAIELFPDIVIMDISMPVMDGIEATRQIRKKNNQIKIIALSMHADKQFIKGMFELGVSGYLFKNCSYDELVEAIKVVYSDRVYLSDRITEFLIKDYLSKEEYIPVVENTLTERETEILKLIANGMSIANISKKLFVSVKTVGTHKQNILDKLNIKSTADLVKYAIRKGIVSID